jgi:hypothetical protein
VLKELEQHGLGAARGQTRDDERDLHESGFWQPRISR